MRITGTEEMIHGAKSNFRDGFTEKPNLRLGSWLESVNRIAFHD